MVETTRVEKYKEYRKEIKKIDNPSLSNPKKTAVDNKKNSLEQNSIIHSNTSSLSLDELMSEHSKYVNEEEKNRLQEVNARKEIRKKRMLIFLLGSFILLCLIVFAIFIIYYL